jgi:hypothetical protein
MLVDKQNDDDRWSEPQQLDDVVPAPTQPAGSVIELKQFADGVSIRVPPAGLWKGNHGLFFFSLLWNGFMVIFTIFMVGGVLLAEKQEGEPWIIIPFLGVFWLVGIGMMLAGIHMGKREAALAVAGGTLMVMQIGLFGKKQREWLLGDIASIRVEATGMEVNDVPVNELRIYDTAGAKFSLLAGRKDEELEWLAHELRAAARVPA